jgi:hypothetical protein
MGGKRVAPYFSKRRGTRIKLRADIDCPYKIPRISEAVGATTVRPGLT